MCIRDRERAANTWLLVSARGIERNISAQLNIAGAEHAVILVKVGIPLLFGFNNELISPCLLYTSSVMVGAEGTVCVKRETATVDVSSWPV